MSFNVCEGDPPLCGGYAGCEFVHPPGMLCREQRTALTTRARFESKRDMGQVARYLQNSSSPMDESCASSSHYCDRTPLSYSSHRNVAFSYFGHSCSCNSKTSEYISDCSSSSGDELMWSNGILPNEYKTRCNNDGASKRRRSHKFYFPKLREAFVWLCLLCLMYPVCSKAVPVVRSNALSKPRVITLDDMNMNGTPKWINPCGIGEGIGEEAMPPGLEVASVSEAELLNQIVLQAKIAFTEIDSRKKDFVETVFKLDYENHHKSWLQTYYTWLPSKKDIPKELGQGLPQEYLNSIKDNLDDVLINTYEYLQRYAVGLEQVASDHAYNNSPFKDLFASAEYKLRAVLCEIQVAIIERSRERRPDVKRDIMGDEYRSLEGTYRNLRDWIIYRDYMNALEYIIKVFEFYSKTIKS